MMGFTEKPLEDLSIGDIIVVYNNQEVPADVLLINVHGDSAFFDTVNLDGEPVLTERFAIGENIKANDV